MSLNNDLISSRKKNEPLNKFLKYLSNLARPVNYCHRIFRDSTLKKIVSIHSKWIFESSSMLHVLMSLNKRPSLVYPTGVLKTPSQEPQRVVASRCSFSPSKFRFPTCAAGMTAVVPVTGRREGEGSPRSARRRAPGERVPAIALWLFLSLSAFSSLSVLA